MVTWVLTCDGREVSRDKRRGVLAALARRLRLPGERWSLRQDDAQGPDALAERVNRYWRQALLAQAAQRSTVQE